MIHRITTTFVGNFPITRKRWRQNVLTS